MGGLKDWRRAKMTEYIEREAAIKEAFAERDSHSPYTPKLCGMMVGAEKVAARLKRIPAADARPVTLCRDCKHNNACLTQAFVEDESKVPFDRNTFFCADGKRADDA
jgi:hypothetical protein